tara:strand:+ start:188 stop:610 length:423 start_codon:yes stop_codon:yes gene_type:complete
MLLMSDKLKDQVDVDNLYDDKTDNKKDVSLYTQIDDSFKCDTILRFESGNIVQGSLFEIENTCAALDDKNFEKISLKFYTSSKAAAVFMSEKILTNIEVIHQNQNILNCNPGVWVTVTKNIKIEENGQTICQLIVRQSHK